MVTWRRAAGRAAGVAALVVVAMLAAGGLRMGGAERHAASPTAGRTTPPEPQPPSATGDDGDPEPAVEREPGEPSEAVFARGLRRRFGRTIGHGHTQVQAIERVLAFLQRFHPDDWRARVRPLLAAAFPERADELLAQLERLVRYQDLVRERRGELATLPPQERRAALWAMRREVFGEAVEEIWEVALRNEQVRQALDGIRAAPPPSVHEKLDRYVAALRDAWGERAETFVARRQTELMTQFLAVDAVQDDLHAMPEDARREALRSIRGALGLDDAALARWDALDAERDEAWALGQRYLAERERIEAATAADGEERAQQIAALQERLFGEQADAIRAEEEAGFHRFRQRRRIGRE